MLESSAVVMSTGLLINFLIIVAMVAGLIVGLMAREQHKRNVMHHARRRIKIKT